MKPAPAPSLPPADSKDYMTASMLSLFLGIWGIDRFYLGYIGTGIAKLLTFGGLGLWSAIDSIRIVTGDMRDARDRELAGFSQNKRTVWIVAAILVSMSILGNMMSLGGYVVVAIVSLFASL